MRKNILIGAALAMTAMLGSAPAAQADDQACIYAYNMHSYFQGQYVRGMYSMNIDGSDIKLLWKDNYSYTESGMSSLRMNYGWIRNERLCGIVSDWPAAVPEIVHYMERDIQTGEVLKDEIISKPQGYAFSYIAAAYCPSDDCVYAVGVSSGSFVLTKAPADKLDQIVTVGKLTSLIYGLTYNEEHGAFAAITGSADTGCNRLVNINPATAEMTTVMNLNPESDRCEISGICWVPSLQRYVYDQVSVFGNQMGGDPDTSELLTLNPANKSISSLSKFTAPNAYDFSFMITMNDKAVASPWGPKEVTNLKANFSDVTGNFTFTLPTTLENGDKIKGDISYSVYIDDAEKLKGIGAPGANVTTNNVTVTKGYHLYRVVLTYNGNSNTPEVFGFTAGKEQPQAPTNVVLTANKLSWDAVTMGISGSKLGEVTYTAKINGQSVATDTKETSIDVSSFINQNGPLTAYTATVTATSNGATSVGAPSNKIVEGAPFTVPFTLTPTEAQFNLCTTADVDKNGITWSYEPAKTDENDPREAGFLSGYDKTLACNDWLFTPKFAVTDKAIYTVSIDAVLAEARLNGGLLSMYVGKEPNIESMKTCLIPALKMTSDNGFQFTGQFAVTGDLAGADKLYIALQATSDAGYRCPIFVRNLSVTKVDGNAVPAAVTDLKANIPESGTNVEVTFKLPTKNLDGTDITASSVDATISLAKVTTMAVQPKPVKVSGAPGAEMKATIECEEWGNLITVTPSANGKDGLGANVVANLSLPLPGLVRNLTAKYSEDNNTVYLEWEAPNTDFEGNPVAEGQYYTYNVYQLNNDSQYELVVENVTVTHADADMSGTEELFDTEFAVAAVNGTGLAPHLSKIFIQVGTPYTLPMEEDFNGNSYKYEPLTPLNVGTTEVNFKWGNPSKLGIGDEFADASVGDVVAAVPAGNNASSRLSFPKFSSKGMNSTTLVFKMWTGANAAKSSVWCQAYDMAAPELVADIANDKAGYNDVTIQLPAKYVDKPWVWIFLDSEYATSAERMVLASYKFSGVSGIDEIAGAGEGAGNVFAARNSIIVKGFAGERAEIYTLDGSRMASVTLNGNTSVAAGKGIYLVRIAGRSYKVIVR